MTEEEKKKRHYVATEKWRRKNWQKCLADQRRRRNANPERTKSHNQQNYYRHRLEFIASTRRWQQRNKERFKKKRADWRKRNAHARTATQAFRKATQLRATPAWANKFFIKEIYHLAALRTKMLDCDWHVDHIVPLQSKVVCGLHVENNLQVIPATKNVSKHNRHWPGMP